MQGVTKSPWKALGASTKELLHGILSLKGDSILDFGLKDARKPKLQALNALNAKHIQSCNLHKSPIPSHSQSPFHSFTSCRRLLFCHANARSSCLSLQALPRNAKSWRPHRSNTSHYIRKYHKSLSDRAGCGKNDAEVQPASWTMSSGKVQIADFWYGKEPNPTKTQYEVRVWLTQDCNLKI